LTPGIWLPMLFNMKRPLILAGIILLAGGVLYEEKHRAATVGHHIVAPDLSYAELEEQSLATNDSFSGSINLWDNPRMKIDAVGLNNTGAAFQRDLTSASFEKIQPASGNETEPALTVLDREVVYALFAKRDFTLTLNLKPEYSAAQPLMPSHIDPGIGGSISF
jgi:hypothetical protein